MTTKRTPISKAAVSEASGNLIKLQRKEEEVTIPISIPKYLQGPLERYSKKRDVTLADAFLKYSTGSLSLELVEVKKSMFLHPRQREIIAILDETDWSATNRAIAEKMSTSEITGEKISPRTVKHHLHILFTKFGVKNKPGLFKKLSENPELLRFAVLKRTESKGTSVA